MDIDKIKQKIEKAKEVHNNYYTYKLPLINNRINIICPIHGEFEQRIDHHLNGHGCRRCKNNKMLNLDDFINISNAKYSNFFNYSKFIYKNSMTKGIIICPIHGEFEQTPSNHINGKMCLKCSDKKNNIKIRNIHSMTEYANNIHNNKYDYSMSIYINMKTKIKILCPEHGVFEQIPDNHISKKQGCPHCKSSKGETMVKKILNELGYKFIEEYPLYHELLPSKHPLFCDFYIDELKLIIEYNGIQHYKPVEFFGGVENLTRIQKCDDNKRKISKLCNIDILEIPYTYNSYNKIKNIILEHINTIK